MSKSSSHNDTHSTLTPTVPDEWHKVPCVQYGFPDGKGPFRSPKLATIYEPIPDDATTVSPVYGLMRDQYERQQQRENPYKVGGGYTSIATELQDQCEADDRALYPIHIESDVYHEEGPATLIEWFRKFTEDCLDVPFHTCTLYYSGNRSIHVHVPRFIAEERQRKRLKELAESYCEETGAKLDCGLYDAKRMFRLPGVKHAKTGLRKVEIEAEWGHTRIIREATKSPSSPVSYAALLQHVFVSQPQLTVPSHWERRDDPLALFTVVDGEKTILEFETGQREIETPLIEQVPYPDDPAEATTWLQYNAKEFSPYALATGGNRSVAALKVTGSPFARKEKTGGTYGRPIHALVPAFFYGARGCAGDEYTKDHVHAPLQLSKLDYPKWEYEPEDYVVLIGGKNGQSIILEVDLWQATVVGHALTGEDASRQAALDYLESEGYDTGEAGTSVKAAAKRDTRSRNDRRSHSGTSQPEAAVLQQQAEREGIETLTHKERWRVACRLLKRGWEPAWAWFERQFGAEFKSGLTHEQLRSVIESFPEDYGNVRVPEKPQ